MEGAHGELPYSSWSWPPRKLNKKTARLYEKKAQAQWRTSNNACWTEAQKNVYIYDIQTQHHLRGGGLLYHGRAEEERFK
jgi:hypothetical protein